MIPDHIEAKISQFSGTIPLYSGTPSLRTPAYNGQFHSPQRKAIKRTLVDTNSVHFCVPSHKLVHRQPRCTDTVYLRSAYD